MNNRTTPVPTAQRENQRRASDPDAEPLDILAEEFGKEAGERIGAALAEEIHNDPGTRRAAATGAGVGVGVVVGLGLLALLTQ